MFSAAQVERAARDSYGLMAAVRSLPGERDSNFHLSTADRREYVLKVIDRDAGPETVDCQLKVLRHVAEQDPQLPIPRIVPTTLGEDTGTVVGLDGTKYTICVLGFLPGRLLAASAPQGRLLEKVGATLARLDRALQGFFHPSLGQRITWDVRRLPELLEHASHIGSASVRSAVERVAAAFSECRSPLAGLRSQAIHGDCHGQNLLVDTQAAEISGILDFGDMIHAPRVLEPAVTMSELLTENVVPLDALSPVLAGYAREQPLEGPEIDLLYDLITARHAVTLLVHAWRSRHDPARARAIDEAATSHAARSPISCSKSAAAP